MEEEKRFDVEFEGSGRATGKMRNDISVTFKTMGETFELATDEGGFHGGDGTAPPPLALFTAESGSFRPTSRLPVSMGADL